MNNKWKMATGKVICPDIKKTGSGFFVGDQGFFITNNHVVAKIDIDKNVIGHVEYVNYYDDTLHMVAIKNNDVSYQN